MPERMSIHRRDMDDGAHQSATRLLAHAAAADSRVQARLGVAIDDFFLPEEARLDDRTRAGMAAVLSALIDTVEGDLRQHGAKLLAGRGETALAAALEETGSSVSSRLAEAGLVRDLDLMRELVGRVRQDVLREALPAVAPDDGERPSLLARLVGLRDSVVAGSAMAVLIADSRRRAAGFEGQLVRTDLPAELHHRLVWWVAAALRERLGDQAGPALPALDRALAEAATRALAAHDEGDRLEAAATRLAAALDAHVDELPELLTEALGDRRPALFIALVAEASGLDYLLARELVLDPAGDRLWLLLRGLELPRETIARIGLALCEGDPRRSLDAFADTLDAVVAVSPEDARAALAPLKLHPDYRAAILSLQRTWR
jgi:hypothetical protein